MNIFHVIILSIVEGITEFLPVSSTGHLILVSHILRIGDNNFTKSFEIIIQVGAILAAVVLYAKTLIQNKQLLTKVIAGFIPAAVIGLILYKFIKMFLLGNAYVTLVTLLLGGIIFIILEKWYFQKQTGTKTTLKTLTIRDALIIGIFQALAVVPGVSRSGSTIVGAMLLGVNRKSAVEFSFMLAIPTMIAASALDIKESAGSFSSHDIFYLILGLVISFVVAYIVIKWFIRFIQDHTFVPFGIYRIVLAIIYFLILVH